jgi:hypothetical protein
VSASLVHGLVEQRTVREPIEAGLALSIRGRAGVTRARAPRLPSLHTGGGLSLELWLPPTCCASRFGVLASSLPMGHDGHSPPLGAGWAIQVTAGSLGVLLSDGNDTTALSIDPDCTSQLRAQPRDGAAMPRHVVLVADGASRLATFYVDGAMCDGGSLSFTDANAGGRTTNALWNQGWQRLPPWLGNVSGSAAADSLELGGGVTMLRVYSRYLTSSEIVGSWRMGPPPTST